MLKTGPAKEVVIRVRKAIGTLNEIARTMADKGINILAISSWVEGAQAVIRLVTDDSVRVPDALRDDGFASCGRTATEERHVLGRGRRGKHKST